MTTPSRSHAPVGNARRLTLRFASFLAALLLGSIGCTLGPPEGQIVELTGQVMTSKGEPLTAGTVEFDGFTGAQRKAAAKIDSDGSFTLETIRADGERQRGVPEGFYRCSILLESNDENAKPIRLPQSYKVSKDMKQPLIILVPRQRATAPSG